MSSCVRQLVALWAVFAVLLAASVEALAVCEFRGGRNVIRNNCIWQQADGAGAVQLQGPPAAVNSPPPILVLESDGKQQVPTTTVPGFTLDLQRVLIKGVKLAPSTGQGGVPLLLPLGLFSTAPAQFSMVDTRLLVQEQDFQEYLAFFSKQLDAKKLTAEGGSITMYTDNKSFLFIPAWSDGITDLLSVTIASRPCQHLGDLNKAGILKLPQPGCNVMAADNNTLLATLLRNASIATPETLLIRITSNVTIGPSFNTSVPIRRPVVLLGMASSLTSVDFGMTMNVLNVTPPTGTLVFQGLVLENLAPGDSVSSLIAPPYSITTSTNMWPVYCNRSAALCVRMSNVTMVIPSEREVNYHIFMYTMYNSPAPSLRQLAEFMRTDLGFKQLEFMAGPGNDTMTIKKLRSRSWQFKDVITTILTFVAPKLPVPPRPFVLSKGGPAPLVTAISGCETFDAALNYNSTRVFVWQLQRNVSLGANGQLICNLSSGYVAASTYLFGQGLDTDGQQASGQPADGGPADGTVLQPGATAAGAGTATASPPGATVHSLSFGYVPNWFELPTDAQDKFMQVQNVTLAQLPQLPDTGGGAGSQGRSLRDLPGVSSPPGVWTVLLWSWQRSLRGSPLNVADTQLMLPEPEWSLLAQVARDDDSFTMQLQGSVGITFTGVALLQGGRAIRVGSLQGPGIRGTNLWLLQDPTPVSAIPGYAWPSNLVAAAAQAAGSGEAGQAAPGGLSTAAQAAVGVSMGVVGVLAVAAAALLLRRRHRRRQADQDTLLSKAHAPDVKGAALVWRASGRSASAPSAQGELCDVAPVADVSGHTPSHRSLKGTTAGVAAAGVVGTPGSPSSVDSRGSSAASAPAAAAYRRARSTSASAADSADVDVHSQQGGGSSSSLLEQSIAQGLQRWNSAVSATTLHLMKRRLEVNNHSAMLSGGSSSLSGRLPAGQQAPGSLRAAHDSGQQSPGAKQHGSDAGPLQTQQIIGTGSFGSVYLGTWRGKQVAIKVMHLPADALADPPDHERAEQQSGGSSTTAAGTAAAAASNRRRRQREQNSPPHMAIMEAVVSSAMSHPNVVQVFTYMLTPLMACELDHSTQQQPQHRELCNSAVEAAAAKPGVDASKAPAKDGTMLGWQLRLIMEYCDQGTLREALDCRRLPLMQGTSFPDPLVVHSLAHDTAAALLHLLSEGIVHGDLKAGNVLLTAASIASSAQQYHSNEDQGNATALAWMQAGCLPLTAKVADFGLATPLGHADTHATMMTRGTPTHMSPELFMSGHVSKASDVYAFGILLYELVTGLRAFAGVPVPLLPHEVAKGKLRPEWPGSLPSRFCVFKQLAECCWAQEPGDRPSVADILARLEGSCVVAAAASTDTQPVHNGMIGEQESTVKQPEQRLAERPAAAHSPAGPQQPQYDQRQQRHVCIDLPQDIHPPARLQQQQEQHLQQQQQSSNTQPPYDQCQAQNQGHGREVAVTAAEVAASPATTQSNRNALDWSEVSYGRSS